MPKKTIKAKTKRVESKKIKKKKVVKKKTTKKKVVKKKATKKKKVSKKTTKKKLVKKKTKQKKNVKRKVKRKRKTKISMEDIYSIINKVQLNRKKKIFTTDIILAPTIENIIKDQEIKYKKIEQKTQVVFTLYPSEQCFDDKLNEELMEIDFLEDEISDPEQIFP